MYFGDTIGENMVEYARGIVTKLIPDNCCVAGISAKDARYLDSKN